MGHHEIIDLRVARFATTNFALAKLFAINVVFAELSPQLVTFNGNSFDLPVLRYRAMVHGVSAPGLSARPYFHRYTEDAIDLCDALSSFSSQGKGPKDFRLMTFGRCKGVPQG
jgi:3'-5' exonuclease